MEQAAVKRDVYSIITERIISQLEMGVVPWRYPWVKAGAPRNFITKNAYQGMNVWLLANLGYEHNYFLTFKQVTELGATVKNGERGHFVVFWKKKEKEVQKRDGTKENKMVSILRYYVVFNIAQCKNIPEDMIPANPNVAHPIEKCEEIVTNMPQRPEIYCKKNEAYYDPIEDYVNMPKMATFKSTEEFYNALFHELVHSTGHPSRLNRDHFLESKGMKKEEYAIEELVAEMGACFLKSYAGLSEEYFKYNVSYIKDWLRALKNNKRFIFYASGAAQRATDFILNIKNEPAPAEEVQTITNS